MFQLGFVSAILPDLSLDEAAVFAKVMEAGTIRVRLVSENSMALIVKNDGAHESYIVLPASVGNELVSVKLAAVRPSSATPLFHHW